MVPLFSTHVAEGPVVRDVLGDVGNLMNCMVVLKNLKNKPKVFELNPVRLPHQTDVVQHHREKHLSLYIPFNFRVKSERLAVDVQHFTFQK